MLTYTPPHEQDLPRPTERPWMLLLLCLVWLLPGVFGREPLKPDETIVADIVKHMVDGGSLLLPNVAGEPWVERAPLFYWVAAAFATIGKWFGLAVHDGARMATCLFTGLALWGTGMAGRELIGRRHGRSAVLILVGSVGLLLPGHMLSADTTVMAGWAWGLYALALVPRLPIPAGLLLAAALAVCGLAGSLTEPAVLLLVAVGLLGFRAWRTSRYGVVLILAVALAAPVIMAWPLALYKADLGAFDIWLHGYALGFLGGLSAIHAFHPFGYYFKLLPWFAWPGWFLAGATLWMQHDRLAQPRFQLPILAGGIMLACLALSTRMQPGYALLVLPPLALIGAVGLDVLRRGASAFVNWFGVMTFGVLLLCLWVAWSAMHLGYPVRLSHRVVELAPGFVPTFSLGMLLFGLTVTAFWLWAVSRRRPVGRQAVTNWAAGMTACWCLAIAFMITWVDTRTAYRGVTAALAPQLPAQHGCVLGMELQASQRAVFDYYLGLQTQRQGTPGAHSCRWLLRQSDHGDIAAPGGWAEVWHGRRAGDNNEHYFLYRKQGV